MSLVLEGAFTKWRHQPTAPSCAPSMRTLGCRGWVLRSEDHPHNQQLCGCELGPRLPKPRDPGPVCGRPTPAPPLPAQLWVDSEFISLSFSRTCACSSSQEMHLPAALLLKTTCFSGPWQPCCRPKISHAALSVTHATRGSREATDIMGSKILGKQQQRHRELFRMGVTLVSPGPSTGNATQLELSTCDLNE